MLYSIKKLAKIFKKSEAVIRIILDRYNIQRRIIKKRHFYEISEEQMEKIKYFIKNRRDLNTDKENKEEYFKKIKEFNKKWNKMIYED